MYHPSRSDATATARAAVAMMSAVFRFMVWR
jgi:hypothetical protein